MLSATSNDMMVVSLVGSIIIDPVLCRDCGPLVNAQMTPETINTGQTNSRTNGDYPDPHHPKRED
jgi:hypothetical protein